MVGSIVEVTQDVAGAVGDFTLHPDQADGPTPVVQEASADGSSFTFPSRPVAVFVAE